MGPTFELVGATFECGALRQTVFPTRSNIGATRALLVSSKRSRDPSSLEARFSTTMANQDFARAPLESGLTPLSKDAVHYGVPRLPAAPQWAEVGGTRPGHKKTVPAEKEL